MTNWQGEEWDRWGRSDPYFAVVSHPEFRAGRLDAAARERFFSSGVTEIADTIDAVRALAGANFRPRRVLDFGCGVGRLTIPLARASDQVVGVDVSSAMITEARANCELAGLTNVEFSDVPDLGGVAGEFDFIHSYIVFQHIPNTLGYRLAERLLDRVSPRGAGMLHFTFARRGPLAKRLAHRARRSSKLVHRMLNLVQGRRLNAPLMALYEYDLGRIVSSLQRRGFDRIGGRLTDHEGCQGIMLAFARSRAAR